MSHTDPLILLCLQLLFFELNSLSLDRASPVAGGTFSLDAGTEGVGGLLSTAIPPTTASTADHKTMQS